MANELQALACEACSGTTPTLTSDEISRLRTQLDPAWHVSDRHLSRDWTFPNFRQAFDHATQVAELAEAEQHHPDMEVAWGKLRVVLTTHAINALSKNDFIMAAKIDALATNRSDVLPG